MISGGCQAVMLSMLLCFAIVLKTLLPYTQLLILSWENSSLKELLLHHCLYPVFAQLILSV